MIPTGLVVLESLPLTANGKVDRNALPSPESPGGEPVSAGMAPRTPVEEILAAIWSEVLGVERVGSCDSFFDLGGHSLLATRVVSQLRGVFRVELGVHELFEEPTVAGLGRRVEAAVRSGLGLASPPIERVPRDLPLPLSFAQQRLWFIDQLEEGALYNVPMALRANGDLSVARWSRVLAEVVRRHEILRTRFVSSSGQPVQVIDPPSKSWALPVIDLRGLPALGLETESRRLRRAESARPFDLSRGPLLRSSLVRREDASWDVLFTMHHIVSDGWSMGILVREVSALYGELAQGIEPSLPELPLQYADFAVWQRAWLSGAILEQQLAYWREHLAGVPPVLELPLDHPRPAVQSFRGSFRRLALGADLVRDLRALSQSRGATVFMTLLAVFQVLLGRLSGQEPWPSVPDRRAQPGRDEGLIGFFVNTLVLRGEISEGLPFSDLLSRVREETLAAYAHQDLPFEKLVEELAPERSLGQSPLFQAMLVLQNTPTEAFRLPALTLALQDVGIAESKFDLMLTFLETESGFEGFATYCIDLFEATTIERWLEQYRCLMASAVAQPETSLGALSWLGERPQQLLCEWSDGGVGEPGRSSRSSRPRSDRSPDAVAVVGGQGV